MIRLHETNAERQRSVVFAMASFAFFCGLMNIAFAKSVRDFGAKGDGKTNDSDAFKAAFASGDRDISIPPGVYVIGPEALRIADQTQLRGAGPSTVLRPAPGTTELLTFGNEVRVEKLHVDGRNVQKGGLDDGLFVMRKDGQRATLDSVSFGGCNRTCILADHSHDLVVRGCEFRNVGTAINITYANRARVSGNRVFNAREHGMQFWGNWKFERKECSDLLFTNNYIKNGGRGAIWGSGGKRVIISDNIVDGALDVGLDLEWCEDSVISGNSVCNGFNAGIALFFACERVTISGNTVNNNCPMNASQAKEDYWVRSGIWLTQPNRTKYPADSGHRDVTIVGNTVYSPQDLPRRSIWVGRESRNVTVANNTLNGGKLKNDSSPINESR